ncbi:NUDIX hydrolase [soil metagenome]
MRFSEEEHRKWFNGQSRKPMSAAVLLMNEAGEVLLVKPNYRDTWNLPGGVIDEHESPLDGAIREVKEELDLTLDRQSLRFSSVDYRPAADELVDKLYFYFYGGILNTSSISQIRLQEDELDEMRFVALQDARELLSPWTYRQVSSALSDDVHSYYLEKGTSPFEATGV